MIIRAYIDRDRTYVIEIKRRNAAGDMELIPPDTATHVVLAFGGLCLHTDGGGLVFGNSRRQVAFQPGLISGIKPWRRYVATLTVYDSHSAGGEPWNVDDSLIIQTEEWDACEA